MTDKKVWKAHISFKGILETEGMEPDRIKRLIEEGIRSDLITFGVIEKLKIVLELM